MDPSILDKLVPSKGLKQAGELLLNNAAKKKNIQAINVLLGMGASVNAQNTEGLTVLSTACYKQQVNKSLCSG